MESMPQQVNNAGKSYNAATVAIVLCVVSGMLVFLRFAEKIRMHAFVAEDYVLIPGFVSICLPHHAWTTALLGR